MGETEAHDPELPIVAASFRWRGRACGQKAQRNSFLLAVCRWSCAFPNEHQGKKIGLSDPGGAASGAWLHAILGLGGWPRSLLHALDVELEEKRGLVRDIGQGNHVMGGEQSLNGLAT